MSFRTDRHNNPAAFTTDIAKQGGLVEGRDYEVGEPFQSGSQTFHTARLLHNPVALTIKVINNISFYAKSGGQRWIYIGMPDWLWKKLTIFEATEIIHFMYKHEGGTALEHLFATHLTVAVDDKIDLGSKLG